MLFGNEKRAVESCFSAKIIAEELTRLISSLPLPTDAAKYYGEVRSRLEKQSTPIGNHDLWIAAHAMAMNLVVVTNHQREFSRIPKLRLENWVDHT